MRIQGENIYLIFGCDMRHSVRSVGSGKANFSTQKECSDKIFNVMKYSSVLNMDIG